MIIFCLLVGVGILPFVLTGLLPFTYSLSVGGQFSKNEHSLLLHILITNELCRISINYWVKLPNPL